jgi:hypothetical protein
MKHPVTKSEIPIKIFNIKQQNVTQRNNDPVVNIPLLFCAPSKHQGNYWIHA